jgi:hypothetical protein
MWHLKLNICVQAVIGKVAKLALSYRNGADAAELGALGTGAPTFYARRKCTLFVWNKSALISSKEEL